MCSPLSLHIKPKNVVLPPLTPYYLHLPALHPPYFHSWLTELLVLFILASYFFELSSAFLAIWDGFYQDHVSTMTPRLCVYPACVCERRPLLWGVGTLGTSPHSLEFKPVLPLLTAHNPLIDAIGNGYRVQRPKEFSLFPPILKSHLFHVLESHTLSLSRHKKGKCAAVTSTTKEHWIEILEA